MEKFKLPGSSYKELANIILAYNAQNGPASPKEVASYIKVHETTISLNNGFLVNIGVITSGNKKTITEIGKLLAGAIEHQLELEIKNSWYKVINEIDFFHKIISAVKIRKSMEQNSLQSHIAYTAGAGKKNHTLTGANTVIEILKIANIFKEENGIIEILKSDKKLERQVEFYPININL